MASASQGGNVPDGSSAPSLGVLVTASHDGTHYTAPSHATQAESAEPNRSPSLDVFGAPFVARGGLQNRCDFS